MYFKRISNSQDMKIVRLFLNLAKGFVDRRRKIMDPEEQEDIVFLRHLVMVLLLQSVWELMCDINSAPFGHGLLLKQCGS
jgi:hypothetical protein